uniref:Uncharacterized protein n=1 Tax=Anguilla anguilla TaxID=7936 RepID=A0A0E9UHI7_ANGAN
MHFLALSFHGEHHHLKLEYLLLKGSGWLILCSFIS